MIDLYTWSTPNGRKISIALEELGLPYRARGINISKGDQFEPRYLKISPNGKIPALVDHDTQTTVFESGAILIYLAEKTGKLLPQSGPERYQVLQWLMFQMGGFGPMLGQAHHFLKFATEDVPYAKDRYQTESKRLFQVLNQHLEGREYVANEFSIADIALYPWSLNPDWKGVDIENYPNIQKWQQKLGSRPSIIKGMKVPG